MTTFVVVCLVLMVISGLMWLVTEVMLNRDAARDEIAAKNQQKKKIDELYGRK